MGWTFWVSMDQFGLKGLFSVLYDSMSFLGRGRGKGGGMYPSPYGAHRAWQSAKQIITNEQRHQRR